MAKEYARGDEVTVGGQKAVVTGTGFNNGNPEYTIAFQQEDGRPVSVGALVDPQAFTNGQPELLQVNAEKQAEVNEEAAKATEEAEKANDDKADSDEVKGTDSPEVVREKTGAPDPAKTPAINSVPAKPGTATAAKK